MNVYNKQYCDPAASIRAIGPGQGNGGESEDTVRFHGRSISHLPTEVLAGITHYLSMCEVLALGQVWRNNQHLELPVFAEKNQTVCPPFRYRQPAID